MVSSSSSLKMVCLDLVVDSCDFSDVVIISELVIASDMDLVISSEVELCIIRRFLLLSLIG